MARGSQRDVSVLITDLTEDGLGVGQINLPDSQEQRIVAVRNALPTEQITARVLKRRHGTWFAQARQIEHRAAHRVEPVCDYFPRCGGCVLQHLDYHQQLEMKQRGVLEALEVSGVRPQRVWPAVSGPRTHYRHKARLGVRCLGSEVLLGFREGFSNRVMRMSDCKTLVKPFAEGLGLLKDTLAALSVPNKIPQLELSAGDRNQAIVLRHLESLTHLDRRLLAACARRLGMEILLQPAGYDSIESLEPGEREVELSYALPEFGLLVRFLATDFIQVNLSMNRKLVRAVVTALDASSGTRVADLFCGIGNFSLALARHGARVMGFEMSLSAVQRARSNADLNGVAKWCEFYAADLYDASAAELIETEYALLDPPRTGAGPNLATWLAAGNLRRAAYVSCNPKTFATDAAVFKSQGFALAGVGVFDMFPHTAHVETLGIFRR